MAAERSLGRKSTPLQLSFILAQIGEPRARKLFAEANVVEIDAGLKVVASLPMERRQVQCCRSLLPFRMGGQVFKVAPLCHLRSNFVRAISVGFVTVAEAHHSQANLQQSAICKTILVT